jgi:hypothetical protein
MRFPTVAFCTLTVLLAGALTAQASESITSGDSAQEPTTPEVNKAASGVDSETPQVTAELNKEGTLPHIVQPEAIPSGPEFSLNADDTSAAKTQVAVKENVNASTLKTSPNSSLLAQRQKEGVVSKAEALRSDVPTSATTNTQQIVAEAKKDADATCIAMANSGGTQLAQGTVRRCPRPQAIPQLEVPELSDEYGSSPGLSIYIPVGYGADNNTVFLTGTYQNKVRDTAENDEGAVGTGGIGIGLGDATKAVGVELSYAFETNDDPFGQGGFNAKLHRRLGQDASIAIGGNGLLNIGRNDFEQSKYGVITKVFRTQDSLNKPFSRVAVTAGVGDGQFRSNGAVKVGDNNVNVFGNVAVRVARPVSFIAEWTGQDLGLGLSIAPFRSIPFVITPAVRDVVGGGDGPRFVLGAGTAFRF